jgi:hypothetical protein
MRFVNEEMSLCPGRSNICYYTERAMDIPSDVERSKLETCHHEQRLSRASEPLAETERRSATYRHENG